MLSFKAFYLKEVEVRTFAHHLPLDCLIPTFNNQTSVCSQKVGFV